MAASTRIGSLVAAFSLVLAACTGSAASAPPTVAPTAPATAAPTVATSPVVATAAPTPAPTAVPSTAASAATLVIGTAKTSLGVVLVGPTGLTLYTHAGDTATSSTCTGGCATAWPPLAVPTGQQASAGAGVTGAFATLTRADGTLQLTYAGLPLYYWQGDTKAGDVTGQGIAGFVVATAAGTAPAASGKPAPSASDGYGY